MPDDDYEEIKVDLDAIERRASAATDGPWWAHDRGVGFEIARGSIADIDRYGRPTLVLPCGDRTDIGLEQDAEFIAKARTDVPQLVAEVRWLRKNIGDALAACDRMMLGETSPSLIVAHVREALRWKYKPEPTERPFVGCQQPCGDDTWCCLPIAHDPPCLGVAADQLPPTAA